jgi:hypothetical protein
MSCGCDVDWADWGGLANGLFEDVKRFRIVDDIYLLTTSNHCTI